MKKRRRQSQPKSRVANGGSRRGSLLGGLHEAEEGEEDADDLDSYDDSTFDDCLSNTSNGMVATKKRRRKTMMAMSGGREGFVLNDELMMLSSGRTPTNSSPWTAAVGGGVGASGKEAKGGREQQHPQLAAHVQRPVGALWPEQQQQQQVPRLKIRTNGVTRQPEPQPQQQQHQAAVVGNSAQSEDLYCYCRRPYVGEMIGCDGEGCHIEWFHFECVDILMAPQGKWYCPDCSRRRMKGSSRMANGQQYPGMTKFMYHD